MQHGRALLESRPFLTRIPADDVIVAGSRADQRARARGAIASSRPATRRHATRWSTSPVGRPVHRAHERHHGAQRRGPGGSIRVTGAATAIGTFADGRRARVRPARSRRSPRLGPGARRRGANTTPPLDVRPSPRWAHPNIFAAPLDNARPRPSSWMLPWRSEVHMSPADSTSLQGDPRSRARRIPRNARLTADSGAGAAALGTRRADMRPHSVLLLQTGFLRETHDGSFARVLDEPAPRVPSSCHPLARHRPHASGERPRQLNPRPLTSSLH